MAQLKRWRLIWCPPGVLLLWNETAVLLPARGAAWTCLAVAAGLGELVDGLLAYSARHLSRVDRLLRSTHLLDYSLAAMKVRSPRSCSRAPRCGERTAACVCARSAP